MIMWSWLIRNSLPPTTTPANFAEKLQAAKDHISVDVAFWGGIIPGNQVNQLNIIFFDLHNY